MGVLRKALGDGVIIGLALSQPAAAFDELAYQASIEAATREGVLGKFENFDATLTRLDEAAAESSSDLLVHPVTTWVDLNAWRSERSPVSLELAKNELIEVPEHLRHAK